MESEIFEAVKQSIKDDEALRLKMYRDSEGIETIGYGHNLRDKPISERAADMIFDDDFRDAVVGAHKVPEYHALCSARKAVIVEMVYNLGLPRFMGFVKTRKNIAEGNFDRAAIEMLDSKWATQVKGRAKRLARIMQTGVYES